MRTWPTSCVWGNAIALLPRSPCLHSPQLYGGGEAACLSTPPPSSTRGPPLFHWTAMLHKHQSHSPLWPGGPQGDHVTDGCGDIRVPPLTAPQTALFRASEEVWLRLPGAEVGWQEERGWPTLIHARASEVAHRLSVTLGGERMFRSSRGGGIAR